MIPDDSDLDGGDVPWAMQVVVRIEREDPPGHTDVLRATASAVALALAAFTGPEADEDVRARTERWRSGPIRKVVRRARGAGWTRQLAVAESFTHAAGGVEVTVHVPGPVDRVDPEIARLQVGGTDLSDDPATFDASVDVAAASVRLLLNPLVEMTTGKAAAQVGHAAQLVLERLSAAAAERWLAAGAPVEVATAPADEWESLRAAADVVVADGGFTEVAPGTVTVVALLSPVTGER